MDGSSVWRDYFQVAIILLNAEDVAGRSSLPVAKRALSAARELQFDERRLYATAACEGLLAYCRRRYVTAEKFIEFSLANHTADQVVDRYLLLLNAEIKLARKKYQEATRCYEQACQSTDSR
ncbi:hypothetical protein BH10CYA1_BH10CYA1_32560 [soil metagenome]